MNAYLDKKRYSLKQFIFWLIFTSYHCHYPMYTTAVKLCDFLNITNNKILQQPSRHLEYHANYKHFRNGAILQQNSTDHRKCTNCNYCSQSTGVSVEVVQLLREGFQMTIFHCTGTLPE